MIVTDTAVVEMEELKGMIAGGQERGFLTSEAIAAALEEAELSGEQAHDLFSYLEEHGHRDPRAGRCRRMGHALAEPIADEHDPIDDADPLARGGEHPLAGGRRRDRTARRPHAQAGGTAIAP